MPGLPGQDVPAALHEHAPGVRRILDAAASRDTTRLEQDAYRVGKSDLRAVNQRQLAQWGAEVALLHVQRERLARRVDLHLALGGNFGGPPIAPPVAATDSPDRPPHPGAPP